MAYPDISRRIINANRYRYDGNITPCRLYQNLYFKFKFPGQQSDSLERLKRIDTVSGLSIRQIYSGIEAKPEIGKFVAEGTLPGIPALFMFRDPMMMLSGWL